MELSGVMIGSADAAGLVAYYTKLFGKPSMEEDNFAGWQLGSAWLVVGPHDEVKGQNSEPGRSIVNISTSDVKRDFKHLVEAGATVVREPYSPEGGQEMLIATFSDPDGNYFQLMDEM